MEEFKSYYYIMSKTELKHCYSYLTKKKYKHKATSQDLADMKIIRRVLSRRLSYAE